MKSISSITNIAKQIKRDQELYKENHHSLSVLLIKGEDLLNLINDLNVAFFNQISIKHSELNPAETIICYYLFMGFKRKEIAVSIE